MGIWTNAPKYAVLAVLVGGAGIWAWRTLAPDESQDAPQAFVVPELSTQAVAGKQAFDAVCAACHGENALGTDKGPPLVHDIYNPGHHSDEAFFVAAKLGVRQHHWPYGNMPPQPGVTKDEVSGIVQYVRELQVANGITTRPHTM